MSQPLQILSWSRLLAGREVGEIEASELLAYVQDTRDCQVTTTPEGENSGTLLSAVHVRQYITHQLREGQDLPVASELLWSMIEKELEPGVVWVWLKND